MKGVFVAADSIISSLGFTTEENWQNLERGVNGIKVHSKFQSSEPVYASLVNSKKLDNLFMEHCNPAQPYTRFEKFVILSIRQALKNVNLDMTSDRTLIILSTTKGNINLLADDSGFDSKRVYLAEAARMVQRFYQNPNTPIVVSNACISGVLAIMIGKRLLDAGKYDHVVVSGADIVSDFVISGFQSLKALADGPCRPYDADRNGLNLGEGCATVVLSAKKEVLNHDNPVYVLGGASSNDANHISGPSRDGEGLFQAMGKILHAVSPEISGNIDYISAHGTATVFNDEMESYAISRAGLEEVPLNSLKGYFGHALGAAGVIESVIASHSLRRNLLLRSEGFKENGVSKKINVITENRQQELNNCLKVVSGFGGCNAGILLSKNEY